MGLTSVLKLWSYGEVEPNVSYQWCQSPPHSQDNAFWRRILFISITFTPASFHRPASSLDVFSSTQCITSYGIKQEAQPSLRWADRTAYIQRLTSDFRSWKESNFPEWVRSGDAAISNTTINARIRLGNLAQMRDWPQTVTVNSQLRPNLCR